MKRTGFMKAAAFILCMNLTVTNVMAMEVGVLSDSNVPASVHVEANHIIEEVEPSEVKPTIGESASLGSNASLNTPTTLEIDDLPGGYCIQNGAEPVQGEPISIQESAQENPISVREEANLEDEASVGEEANLEDEAAVGVEANPEDEAIMEEVNPEDEASVATESLPETEQSSEPVPELEENQTVMYTASVVQTYTLSSTITATLDSDGLLTIQGSGKMPSYSSENPPWNAQRNQIKKVKINSGITEIGEAAFYECSQLKEADIADSVTVINKAAFCRAGLQTISMTGVKTIGDYAFEECTFTAFTFPAGTITVGDYVFLGCNNLTSITIPAATKELGAIAYQCPNLTTITVNSNPYFVAEDSVLYTKDKKSLVAVPAGKQLTSFTIPSTVTRISACAFFGHSTLQTITIPSSVREIGDYAFHSVVRLKSLTVPSTVTSVGYGICENCTSLETLSFLANIEITPYRLCFGCTSLTRVTLGNNIKEIDLRTFMGCTKLSGVTLPSKLEKIDVYAFKDCTSLSNVTFPQSITYIQSGAFDGSSVTAMPSWLQMNSKGDCVLLTTLSISGTYNYDMAYEVLGLVNQQRQAAGLNALTMDQDLLNAAMIRAGENCLYFGHERPDGTECYTLSNKITGENVAAAYADSNAVMEGWMNSSGHRANILGSGYTSIGIGCFVQNGTPYWVQVFGNSTIKPAGRPANQSVTQNISVACSLLEGATFRLRQSTYSYGKGGKLTLIPYIANMGWSYASCELNPTAFQWSSNHSQITVNANGVVSLGAYGNFTITAKLKAKPNTELKFSGNCNSEANKTRMFVERLYETCLGRDSEVDGLDYWTSELTSNRKSGASVGYGFVFSNEYKNKHTTDADYVEMLYQVFMDRTSDANGKAYWVNLLNQGMSREYVFAGFAHSQEYTSICNSYGITRGTVTLSQPRDKNANLTAFVNRIYVEAMGRTGEADGLNYWCRHIQSGAGTPISVSEFFINSQEFRNKRLNNTEYVKVLYRTFMGREADQSGLNYWVTRLNSGDSREAVLKSFAGCPEFQNIIRSFGL